MKKCLISFNWGKIWRKYSHRGQYFSPIFVCIEFGFAPMFPFNNDTIDVDDVDKPDHHIKKSAEHRNSADKDLD